MSHHRVKKDSSLDGDRRVVVQGAVKYKGGMLPNIRKLGYSSPNYSALIAVRSGEDGITIFWLQLGSHIEIELVSGMELTPTLQEQSGMPAGSGGCIQIRHNGKKLYLSYSQESEFKRWYRAVREALAETTFRDAFVYRENGGSISRHHIEAAIESSAAFVAPANCHVLRAKRVLDMMVQLHSFSNKLKLRPYTISQEETDSFLQEMKSEPLVLSDPAITFIRDLMPRLLTQKDIEKKDSLRGIKINRSNMNSSIESSESDRVDSRALEDELESGDSQKEDTEQIAGTTISGNVVDMCAVNKDLSADSKGDDSQPEKSEVVCEHVGVGMVSSGAIITNEKRTSTIRREETDKENRNINLVCSVTENTEVILSRNTEEKDRVKPPVVRSSSPLPHNHGVRTPARNLRRKSQSKGARIDVTIATPDTAASAAKSVHLAQNVKSSESTNEGDVSVTAVGSTTKIKQFSKFCSFRIFYVMMLIPLIFGCLVSVIDHLVGASTHEGLLGKHREDTRVLTSVPESKLLSAHNKFSQFTGSSLPGYGVTDDGNIATTKNKNVEETMMKSNNSKVVEDTLQERARRRDAFLDIVVYEAME